MNRGRFDFDQVIKTARQEFAHFQEVFASVPYERKGMLYSEIAFLHACTRGVAPRRVLESGRARGQSTLLLSLCFPQSQIISVEHDPDSVDVAVAAERLKDRPNVKLLFGDATRMLPTLATQGDIALIDGPKGLRALRLAFSLLATRKVALVFVHDASPGTAERIFLEKHLGNTCYSDDPRYTRDGHMLDLSVAAEIPSQCSYAATRNGFGYGYSLACLPYDPTANYSLLNARTAWAGVKERFARRPAGDVGQ